MFLVRVGRLEGPAAGSPTITKRGGREVLAFTGRTVKVLSRYRVLCNDPRLVGKVVALDDRGNWIDHLQVHCLIDGRILQSQHTHFTVDELKRIAVGDVNDDVDLDQLFAEIESCPKCKKQFESLDGYMDDRTRRLAEDLRELESRNPRFPLAKFGS